MNRKFLEELGLEKEVIDKVMAEHGKAIQAVKPADYEDLKTEKSNLEQQLSDLQKTLTTKEEELSSVDELKKELESQKLSNLKINIASQANIPPEFAGRLVGETEEELRADAELMAGYVNKKQPLPLKPTEPPQVDEEEQAYAKILENLN